MIISALLSCAFVAFPAVEPEPEREWTLLFYGAADNSSEETLLPDLYDAMRSLPVPGLEVLAFVDRSPEFTADSVALGEDFASSRLFRLTASGPERVAGGDEFSEVSATGDVELNSGDPRTVRKALRWAKATAPAKHYGIVFYSHGGGYGWCPDDTDGDELGPSELTEVLEACDAVDLMVMDVCLMGSVENAYEWRPRDDAFGADVLVATPMAGFPFPWPMIFERVHALADSGDALAATDFGRVIVEATESDRRSGLDEGGLPADILHTISLEAMGCYDLAHVAWVKQATDDFARALSTNSAARDALVALQGEGTEAPLLHYTGGVGVEGWTHFPYVDLRDVASQMAERLRDDDNVVAAARTLAKAVDETVVASYGLTGYADGAFTPGASGLGLLLPRVARFPSGLSWYTSRRPASPELGTQPYAWCIDGAGKDGEVGNWADLIALWSRSGNE